jgi:hypothetical protein
MASTTFSGPVTSTNGFIGTTVLPEYTVANVPVATSVTAGTTVYISNGYAGAPGIGVSDGAKWYIGGVEAAIA